MTNLSSNLIKKRNAVATIFVLSFFVSGLFFFISSPVRSEQPTLLIPKKDVTPSNDVGKQKLQSQPRQRKIDPTIINPPPPPSTRARTPIEISVEDLEKVDSDSVGILTEEQGGFGFDMWEGTSRSLVEKLLPKLPVNSSSRTMRSLMRRLLLSIAKAPTDENREEENLSKDSGLKENVGKKSDGKLLVTRVELLSAMGDTDSVYNLLKVAPNRATNEKLLKNEADVLFLSNDNSRACDLVLGQINNLEIPYWQKASIYCQALAGKHDQANLGANLLREIGEKDEVFFGLINSLTGIEKFRVASLLNPTPLHFSMIRAAKIKLPKNVISAENPMLLKTIATSPNAEPNLRIEAAERAEEIGVLETEVLRQIYEGVAFSQEALDTALLSAKTEPTPLNRALLYRKAMVENNPSVKVEILSQVFKIARATGMFQLTARIYYHILKNLPVSTDMAWFASEAVRALSAVGDRGSAQIWLNVFNETGSVDKKNIVIRDQLAPLVRLNGQIENEAWDPTNIDKWWVAEKSNGKKLDDSDLIYARATLLYNLLEALGDSVPNHLWESLLDMPPQVATVIPQPALWQTLDRAVEGAKLAEVVLISLLMLGESGPTQINPIVLRKVVMSLNLMGLSLEARSLAIEAAVVAGL